MSGTNANANADDVQYRENKTYRNCYCGLILTKKEYAEHLKNGTHNAKVPNKPKEDKK